MEQLMEVCQHVVREERRRNMERLIRDYFDACNNANVNRVKLCFTSDAVHYFPPGTYDGPFRGASKIAEKWCNAILEYEAHWVIDKLLVEPFNLQAVIEWTHFKTKQDTMVRGIEWYEFDSASGLIKEIRTYYAAPHSLGFARLELGSFDYAGRGYVTSPLANGVK